MKALSKILGRRAGPLPSKQHAAEAPQAAPRALEDEELKLVGGGGGGGMKPVAPGGTVDSPKGTW